ncbi:MAG: alpha-amylase family glycosyl hydrolase [Anaerolineae bacterium]
MPVAQSPSYHGYDTTDYTTVEEDYGSNEDFRAADRRGAPARHQGDRGSGAEPHLHRAPLVRRARPAGRTREQRDWYRWSPTDDGSKAPWAGGGPVWHKRGDEYYFAMFWEGMPDLNLEQPRGHGRDAERGPLLAGGDGRGWLSAGRGAPSGGGGHALLRRAGHPCLAGRLRRLRGHGRARRAPTVGEVWDSTAQAASYVQGDEVDLAFEFELAEKILRSVQQGKPRAQQPAVGRAAGRLSAGPGGAPS